MTHLRQSGGWCNVGVKGINTGGGDHQAKCLSHNAVRREASPIMAYINLSLACYITGRLSHSLHSLQKEPLMMMLHLRQSGGCDATRDFDVFGAWWTRGCQGVAKGAWGCQGVAGGGWSLR